MATVNLAPPAADITGVRAGDRNLMTVTVKAGGVAVNLTGYTVTAQARKAVTDYTTEVLDAVVTIIDAAAGLCSVRWPGEAVRTMLAGAATWVGVWDMQIKQTGSDPITVAAGTFKAEQDVTRP